MTKAKIATKKMSSGKTKTVALATEEKNKGGRPIIVLNNEQIKELEDMAAYFTVEQIAEYFDISERCLYDLRHRNNEVFAAYKKGRMRKIYRYAKTLENKAFGVSDDNALKYDTASIIFFLKTQAGWAEKQQQEITYKGIPPSVNLIENEKPSNRQKD